MDSSNAPKEKLLAVHEAKNSALYLAALFPTNSVYHLSPSPLSPKLATNIIPVHSAKVSSTFPSLPEWFDTTFSISLPSLCSESELGDALKSISRCLKPGGTCNFIVIDPVPAGAVLGDGFRTWLTENVLRNLHKKSRCLRPSARFAHLLGEASLRGPGSTLARTKFYANPENVQRQRTCSDYNTTCEDVEEQKHQETRADLRSLVGRMLWREVWGEFVTAKNWWWDDPVCMKECLELGTFWEYHYIQGVKV